MDCFRGEMDAAPVAVIRLVSTPASRMLCFFSWKYFAHRSTVGQRPRYPSQKATNADSYVMAFAGR